MAGGAEPLLDAILHEDLAHLAALGAASRSEGATRAQRAVFNTPLRSGRTPLNLALAQGSPRVALALLALGASPRLTDSQRVGGVADKGPLHYASERGWVEVVRELVERWGVDVEGATGGGERAVHCAARHGHSDIIQYLVSVGADLNAQDNLGKTPLYKSVTGGHRELALALLRLGADLHTRSAVGETVLFKSVRGGEGQEGIVGDLLLHGAHVGARDISGNTPLHAAALAGGVWACRLLVGAGAVVDTPNQAGTTPLHCALSHAHVRCAALLLNEGASCAQCNARGQTALHHALLHLHEQPVWLLRAVGYPGLDAELTHLSASARSAELKSFYQQLIVRPPSGLSLAQMVRAVIRRHLRPPAAATAQCLPLPAALQGFVLLDDFLDTGAIQGVT